MTTSTPAENAFAFDEFVLVPSERALYKGAHQLRIGARAFDILVALVARAGQIVEKPELFKLVWPTTVVEEINLRVHVSSIRKVLGDGVDDRCYIENVSGRGYRFVAPVQIRSMKVDLYGTRDVEGDTPAHLPSPLARMFGRDLVVETLVKAVADRRLVSIVGTGGVGKTTVAKAVAERVAYDLQVDAQFVDLSSVKTPASISGLVASLSGVARGGGDTLSSLCSAIKARRLLIVFDGCEHLIDAVCSMVEILLASCPDVFVLTTSREPLRADGEQVHRLEPLDVPAATRGLTATEALAYPAVQLFDERARARDGTYQMGDDDAGAVAELCRRLDGLPLALELAAALAESLGIEDILIGLEDRFRLLAAGRRMALPRHQTLRATLDWSYSLLSAGEQTVLRQLSVFPRTFSRESAASVITYPTGPTPDLLPIFLDLVDKSLIVVDSRPKGTVYRLLASTRQYGIEKLREEGEYRRVALRHAEYCLGCFDASTFGSEEDCSDGAIVPMASIEDVRSALNWAFAENGDAGMGVRLTVESARLWYALSLMSEYRSRIRQALDAVEHITDTEDCIIAHLYVLLGHAEVYSNGPQSGAATMAFLEAGRLASLTGNNELYLEALYGLCTAATMGGRYELAQIAVTKIASLTSQSDDAEQLHVRLGALVWCHLGNQFAAEDCAERALSLAAHQITDASIGKRLRFDRLAAVLTIRSRILWLRGFPDQAVLAAEQAVHRALAVGHRLSLGHALSIGACSVASWVGDDVRLRYYLDLLTSKEEDALYYQWRSWVDCFLYGLQARNNLSTDSVDLDQIDSQDLAAPLHELLATQDGLLVTSTALAKAESGEAGWATPEILREHGEAIILSNDLLAEKEAEEYFVRSMALASFQGALSWELRSAMSLARLRQRRGEAQSAYLPLRETFDKFTEGFCTRDLQRAKRILASLAESLQATSSHKTAKAGVPNS